MPETGIKPADKPVKPKHQVDPVATYLMEYLCGARCERCDILRDHNGQCPCERNATFDERAGEIMAFVAEHGDPSDRKKRWIESAAASAMKRASLRAGYRDIPNRETPTMTEHQRLMADLRFANGNALEWKDFQPSGDELPL